MIDWTDNRNDSGVELTYLYGVGYRARRHNRGFVDLSSGCVRSWRRALELLREPQDAFVCVPSLRRVFPKCDFRTYRGPLGFSIVVRGNAVTALELSAIHSEFRRTPEEAVRVVTKIWREERQQSWIRT